MIEKSSHAHRGGVVKHLPVGHARNKPSQWELFGGFVNRERALHADSDGHAETESANEWRGRRIIDDPAPSGNGVLQGCRELIVERRVIKAQQPAATAG